MDRQINPEIFIWPVPDSNATYTFNTRILSQIQDASLKGGATLNLPYRWLDAWVAALAARMGAIYPDALVKAFGPNAVNDLRAQAKVAYDLCLTQDQENVPIYIGGGDAMASYYR